MAETVGMEALKDGREGGECHPRKWEQGSSQHRAAYVCNPFIEQWLWDKGLEGEKSHNMAWE